MKKGLLALVGGLVVAGAGAYALTRKNSEDEDYIAVENEYEDEEVTENNDVVAAE